MFYVLRSRNILYSRFDLENAYARTVSNIFYTGGKKTYFMLHCSKWPQSHFHIQTELNCRPISSSIPFRKVCINYHPIILLAQAKPIFCWIGLQHRHKNLTNLLKIFSVYIDPKEITKEEIV